MYHENGWCKHGRRVPKAILSSIHCNPFQRLVSCNGIVTECKLFITVTHSYAILARWKTETAATKKTTKYLQGVVTPIRRCCSHSCDRGQKILTIVFVAWPLDCTANRTFVLNTTWTLNSLDCIGLVSVLVRWCNDDAMPRVCDAVAPILCRLIWVSFPYMALWAAELWTKRWCSYSDKETYVPKLDLQVKRGSDFKAWKQGSR